PPHLPSFPTRPLFRSEFGSRERRQAQQLEQARPELLVAQHSKEINELVVEVVVNLGIAARLAKPDAEGAAESLDIGAVLAEMRDYPGREHEFAAVPAQRDATNLGRHRAGLSRMTSPRLVTPQRRQPARIKQKPGLLDRTARAPT